MKTYPVKIECVDDMDDTVFHMTTFDEGSGEIELKCLLTRSNIDEILSDIRKAFDMLELEE